MVMIYKFKSPSITTGRDLHTNNTRKRHQHRQISHSLEVTAMYTLCFNYDFLLLYIYFTSCSYLFEHTLLRFFITLAPSCGFVIKPVLRTDCFVL